MTPSTTFTQCAPEATEFGEITQDKGHSPVQGHSRSPTLVTMKAHVRLPRHRSTGTYSTVLRARQLISKGNRRQREEIRGKKSSTSDKVL